MVEKPAPLKDFQQLCELIVWRHMHGSIALREEIGCLQPDKVPQFFLSPAGVMLLWRASEESVTVPGVLPPNPTSHTSSDWSGLHWHKDKRHSDIV